MNLGKNLEKGCFIVFFPLFSRKNQWKLLSEMGLIWFDGWWHSRQDNRIARVDLPPETKWTENSYKRTWIRTACLKSFWGSWKMWKPLEISCRNKEYICQRHPPHQHHNPALSAGLLSLAGWMIVVMKVTPRTASRHGYHNYFWGYKSCHACDMYAI